MRNIFVAFYAIYYMQTFLPFASFDASARVLDRPRLGKQRVEVIQLIKALTLPDYSWKHHPATLMWAGFEEALVLYGEAMSREWLRRGYVDNCFLRYRDLAGLPGAPKQDAALPLFIGDEAFHQAHQSSLLRKDLEFYRLSFPDTPTDLEPIWPVRIADLRAKSKALEAV